MPKLAAPLLVLALVAAHLTLSGCATLPEASAATLPSSTSAGTPAGTSAGAATAPAAPATTNGAGWTAGSGSASGEAVPAIGATGDQLGSGDQAGRTAVVFVHGWSADSSTWRDMRDYLTDQGMGELHAIDLPNRGILTTIEACAQELGKLLQTLSSQGIQRVDLVAHSMGGLVCREYLRTRSTSTPAVSRLVTVATPHHGTVTLTDPSTEIAGTTSRVQMSPGSDFLKRLNAASLPARTAVYSIWAVGDLVILPNESAILAGAVNYRRSVHELDGHSALLRDGSVQALVHQILVGKAPTPVGPQS